MIESFSDLPIFFMQGASASILTSPFFVNIILPFLLIFTVVFAILQKTEVLGKGKRQIDAIVSLVIGLIVVSFGFATGIIVSLVPFLAVSMVIILIFMILYGMVYKEGGFELHNGVKIAIGIAVAIAVIIAVLVATGAWDYVADTWVGDGSGFWANIIFLVIIIIAIVVVVIPGMKGKDK